MGILLVIIVSAVIALSPAGYCFYKAFQHESTPRKFDPHYTRRLEIENFGEGYTECADETCQTCHPRFFNRACSECGSIITIDALRSANRTKCSRCSRAMIEAMEKGRWKRESEMRKRAYAEMQMVNSAMNPEVLALPQVKPQRTPVDNQYLELITRAVKTGAMSPAEARMHFANHHKVPVAHVYTAESEKPVTTIWEPCACSACDPVRRTR